VDGESAARYIKSTNNKNTNTPIIAVSAYSTGDEQNGLFAASLSKPLQRADLLAVMRKLGFKTSAVQGVSHPAAKSIPSRIL
jgi:serine/threonine-protein kinase RIM15